jgi:hypothetical protein
MDDHQDDHLLWFLGQVKLMDVLAPESVSCPADQSDGIFEIQIHCALSFLLLQRR